MSAASDETLPPGWAWATVGELAEVRLGRQRSPDRTTGVGSRPYLRAANVTWQGVDISDVKEMDFTDAEATVYELHAGDILLNEASGSADEVGKSAIYGGEIAGCCFQNTLIRVRVYGAVTTEFAQLCLYNDARAGRFVEHGRGIGIHHLGAAKMQSWPMAVPPLAEQRRIVAALDEALGRVRAARASLDEAPALLERARQAVLAAAFRGELTEAWRAEHPEVEAADELLERIRAERRRRWEEAELAKLTAKGKAPTDDRWKAKYEPVHDHAKAVWAGLPQQWRWTTLDEIVDRIDGGTATTAQSNPTAFPVLKSSAVRQRAVNLRDVSYLPNDEGAKSGAVLREGDLLFTRLSGSLEYVANCARVSGLGSDTLLFPDRVFRAVPAPELVPEWIMFAFSCAALRSEIEAAAKSTAGHQRISLADLRKFVLPLPPLAEQHEIVRRVDAALAKLDAVAAAVEATRAQLDAIERAVLAKAFRGELVPQDAADEPAAEMLARLRETRAGAPTKRGRRAPPLPRVETHGNEAIHKHSS